MVTNQVQIVEIVVHIYRRVVCELQSAVSSSLQLSLLLRTKYTEYSMILPGGTDTAQFNCSTAVRSNGVRWVLGTAVDEYQLSTPTYWFLHHTGTAVGFVFVGTRTNALIQDTGYRYSSTAAVPPS